MGADGMSLNVCSTGGTFRLRLYHNADLPSGLKIGLNVAVEIDMELTV